MQASNLNNYIYSIFYLQIKYSFKKWLLLFFFLQINFLLFAQFNSATIHINGLTCSACSFAVQRSISTIDFVERIEMDLNENIAMIVFKKNKAIDPSKLIQGVKNAGFTVAKLELNYSTQNTSLSTRDCFTEGGTRYLIVDDTDTTFQGDVTFKLIHKSIVPKKEYKKYNKQVHQLSYETCKPNFLLSLR